MMMMFITIMMMMIMMMNDPLPGNIGEVGATCIGGEGLGSQCEETRD